jgi:hypothetical protein
LRRSRAAFVILVLTALPAVAIRGDQKVPFAAGEVLSYDVSWTRFVTAGTATLHVRERRATAPGKAAYYLVAEAKPTSLVESLYHLYYKAESFVDTETLRPSVATMYSDERGRRRRRVTTFKGGGVADYEVQTASIARSQFETPPSPLDPLAALYLIRTLPLKAGLSTTLPLSSNGRNYRVRISVGRREELATPLGRLPAWRVTPLIQDDKGEAATTRNLTVWMSDDGRRLPLRMEVDLPVGTFQLTLTSARGT